MHVSQPTNQPASQTTMLNRGWDGVKAWIERRETEGREAELGDAKVKPGNANAEPRDATAKPRDATAKPRDATAKPPWEPGPDSNMRPWTICAPGQYAPLDNMRPWTICAPGLGAIYCLIYGDHTWMGGAHISKSLFNPEQGGTYYQLHIISNGDCV